MPSPMPHQMPRNREIIAVVVFLAALFAAVRPAHAEPAIWVVKGPHATVYLFGTIHALQKGVPWRSAKIDAAIQQSQTLYGLKSPTSTRPHPCSRSS